MTMLFDCLSTIHPSITLVCLPVVSVCACVVSVSVLVCLLYQFIILYLYLVHYRHFYTHTCIVRMCTHKHKCQRQYKIYKSPHTQMFTTQICSAMLPVCMQTEFRCMIEARLVHVCSRLSARASCRSRAQRVSRACPDSRTELIRHAWNVGLRPKGKLVVFCFCESAKIKPFELQTSVSSIFCKEKVPLSSCCPCLSL